MRACLFIFASFLFAIPGFSQEKKFSSLSKYEKWWAFFHPFAACKIKKHQKEMYAVYDTVKKNNLLDQYSNGGKLDAFRHTFAMAYFTRFVSVKKLRKLGKAHEKGNYLDFKKGRLEDGELPDSISTAMDLKNNELGFEIGKASCKLSVEELKISVVQKINAGSAFIIRRNKEGSYLDCSGNLISEKEKGTWKISKCLVGSGS
jgi:hypothetical protein